MQLFLLLIHVIVSFVLITLVLIQHGKGADVGAAFGSGASQTIFGSQGSGSFLVKVTGILAGVFFVSSLTLGYLQAQQARQMRNLDLPTKISKQAANLKQPPDVNLALTLPSKALTDTTDHNNKTS